MNSQNISRPSKFDYTEWREKFILGILRVASLAGLILIITIYQSTAINDLYIYIGIYIFLVAVTVLPASYDLRVYSLLIVTFGVGVNTILGWGPWSDGTLFILASILLASLLIDRRIDILLLVVSIVFIASIAISDESGLFHLLSPNAPSTTLRNWLVYGADFLVAGVVLIMAASQFKNAFAKMNDEIQLTLDKLEEQKSKLEARVSERTEELENRTKQLHTTTSIARTIAEMQDAQNLLQSVVDLISNEFGYYHVGIYILDDQKRSAFLQSASSETGKQLIGNLFQIESTNKSGFNTVVEKNKYVILSDIESGYQFRDENFPITRSRLVLPLSVRGNILGLLDIHSDQPLVFTPEDAGVLQSLADLVAITFDNIQLLDETKSLVTQLEKNTSIQTNQVWTKLTSRHKPAYQYTPVGVRPIFSRADHNDDKKLRIPLILQGQNIGSIKLQRKGALEEWSQKEKDLINKIAEQVALAVENSRLVDEAQKNAQRDQMLANISQRIRETLDIESVAKTAATELRRIFDLKEAEISIGLPQTEAAPLPKATGTLKLKR